MGCYLLHCSFLGACIEGDDLIGQAAKYKQYTRCYPERICAERAYNNSIKGGLQFATVDTRCSVLPSSHALRHGRFTTLIWIFFGELPLLGGMGGIRRERRE